MGRGTGREKPGRQESHSWDSALNRQHSRVVSPLSTHSGIGSFQICFQLNLLLSKLSCSLKPKNQMESGKERSLCVSIGNTCHLGIARPAGNARQRDKGNMNSGEGQGGW